VTWERIADEYSGSEHVPNALFLAGVARYRLGDYEKALTTLQRSLLLSTKAEDTARAYLWIGKAQEQLGDSAAAQTSWKQGQAADPGGYYSLRARDLLMGRAPFESAPSTNLEVDLLKERKDAEAGCASLWHAPETDLPALARLHKTQIHTRHRVVGTWDVWRSER
jgi:soluble lytic murein transglycosylase